MSNDLLQGWRRCWANTSWITCLLLGAVHWGCSASPGENRDSGNALCGNGTWEPGEECDQDDLRGRSCLDEGFSGGELACTSDCTLDTSGCTGCGDSVCDSDETRETCPADCGYRLVSAGASYACALLGEGAIRCWGSNFDGQLGDGSHRDSSVPVQVIDLTGASTISAGWAHACALTSLEGAWCWGGHYLGNGTSEGSPVPVSIVTMSNILAISAGRALICAVDNSHNISCWGSGGLCGDGTTEYRYSPTAVVGLSGEVKGVTAGGAHGCAAMADGSAWCWGQNNDGQLGDGTLEDRLGPVQVLNITGVQSITAGDHHTCSILEDRSAWCWGAGDSGQLGDGVQRAFSTEPVRVFRLEDVAQLSGGSFHSCALLEKGTAWCWGGDDDAGYEGQIGSVDDRPSWTPVKVAGIDAVTSIAAGGSHSCATLSDGSAWCWGNNYLGQLGNGSAVDRSYQPVRADGP